MKTDPPDSQNVPGAGDQASDVEALRDLVLSTRSGSPSDDAVQRITKRLVAAGALEPSSLSKTSQAGSNATTRIAEKIGYYKVGAIALALAAGSLLAWRATWTSADAPVAALTAPEVVGSTDRSATTGASEPTGSTGTSDVKGTGIAAVSIDALPSAAPTTRAPAAAGSAVDSMTKATTSEPAGAKTATPELLLVRRAQDALASDPARALSIANEHVRLFPSGELTQEREVVAVEALSRLGRKDDALLRATALLRRFPRTPYVAHLEKALGQPLPIPAHRGTPANSPSNPNP